MSDFKAKMRQNRYCLLTAADPAKRAYRACMGSGEKRLANSMLLPDSVLWLLLYTSNTFLR